MDRTFWNDKRVLVTGADGFMGSHLTERLLELGAVVSIFVRGTSHCGTTQYKLKHLSHVAAKLEHIIAGDVASVDAIQLIRQQNPAVIFHLASAAYVPYSFDHPREVHASNLVGTLNVLDAAREVSGLERVVVTSSSEVYGSTEREKIDEDHPLNPSSPYAASKLAGDRYAYAYRRTYGLPIAIIRPFNYYGPRHLYDVIPKFIDIILNGQAPTIYGTGEQCRDFTYVDDMTEAFLTMGSDPRAVGETVNFGSGQAVSIKELAETILSLVGLRISPIYQPTRPAEVNRLCCDATKAFRLFGWTAKVGLEEGLRRNIEWSKTNLRHLHAFEETSV